jgi:membrane dipeptidase
MGERVKEVYPVYPGLALHRTDEVAKVWDNMLIFDAHLDLAWNALEWNRDLTLPVEAIRRTERDLTQTGRGRNTVSLPELRKAEVGFCLATFLARRVVDDNPPFVPYEDALVAHEAARRQADYYQSLAERGLIRVIDDFAQLDSNLDAWRTAPDQASPGCILSMEGADAIPDPGYLDDWWDRGLRVIGPVHYGANRYGHGTGSEGGLTAAGLELLRRMRDLGFVLDVTHLSDRAFEEALEGFSGPVLASHHNCRALVPGQRQLSDEQIRALIDRDAVIGVAFDAWMLQHDWVRGQTEPARVTIGAAVDHIDHVCQIAGDAVHVGIGSDLDGGFGAEQCPRDLNTIADLQRLPVLLDRRGYSPREIENFMHGNWIDFFRRAWEA